MLNIFKFSVNRNTSRHNLVKFYIKKEQDFSKDKREYKHFPPSIREWNNSIYVFNKKSLDFLPQATILSSKLIKNYFNLYNSNIDYKLRTSSLSLRDRSLSSNKIHLSNGEFKHTNNKVIITLYVYNRQINIYTKIIKYNYMKVFTNKIMIINRLLNLIKLKGIQSLKKVTNIKYLFKNTLGIRSNILYKDILYNYIINFYNNFINKSLSKLKLYLYYKELLYINESKFNFTYLQYLKKYLEKVYNKNVEFNFINLRHFYLNSDILIEAIALKIKKDRRKLHKKLKIFTKNIKLYENINLYKRFNIINNRYINKIFINKFIFNNIKYKYITGFRLRIYGRLINRSTASKSITVLYHKGHLLNIDSSYKRLSSVTLKGNLKSNLQFTIVNCRTRVGSFGIRGWLSSN
jgi:hypothetical protein